MGGAGLPDRMIMLGLWLFVLLGAWVPVGLQARKAIVFKICPPLAPESHTAHSSLHGQCRPSGHRTARRRALMITAI